MATLYHIQRGNVGKYGASGYVIPHHQRQIMTLEALTVLPSQQGHHIENHLLLETTESLGIQRFSLEVAYIQR